MSDSYHDAAEDKLLYDIDRPTSTDDYCEVHDDPPAAQGRDELWLSSKVGDWIWRELNAGRSVAAVTRELAERVKEMEARRAAL